MITMGNFKEREGEEGGRQFTVICRSDGVDGSVQGRVKEGGRKGERVCGRGTYGKEFGEEERREEWKGGEKECVCLEER